MKNYDRSKSPSIPTEQQWGDYDSDLDQNHAHSVFAGRTNLEAQALIRNSPIERIEDLRWMPAVPFRYYVMGLRDLIIANDFDDLDAPDAASCFLRLVLYKLQKQPNDIVSVMTELLPAVEHVARNQYLFKADKSIYGDFLDLLAHIHSEYQTPGSA